MASSIVRWNFLGKVLEGILFCLWRLTFYFAPSNPAPPKINMKPKHWWFGSVSSLFQGGIFRLVTKTLPMYIVQGMKNCFMTDYNIYIYTIAMQGSLSINQPAVARCLYKLPFADFSKMVGKSAVWPTVDFRTTKVVEQRKENVKMRIVDISSTLFDSAAWTPDVTRCCMMFPIGWVLSWVSFRVCSGAGKLVFLESKSIKVQGGHKVTR